MLKKGLLLGIIALITTSPFRIYGEKIIDSENCLLNPQAPNCQIISNFNQDSKSKTPCGTCDKEYLKTRKIDSCPYGIYALALGDRGDYFNDSPYEVCINKLTIPKLTGFTSMEEMEAYVSKMFKVESKNLLANEICRNANDPKTGRPLNTNQMKAMLVEYYSSMARIKAGELGAIEQIKAMDLLLEEGRALCDSLNKKVDQVECKSATGPQPPFECTDPNISETKALCEAQKSCKPTGNLGPMLSRTVTDLKQIENLEAAKNSKKLSQSEFDNFVNYKRDSNGLLRDSYLMSEKLKADRSIAPNALRLIANERKLQLERLEKLKNASKCLNHEGDDCDNISEDLLLAPPIGIDGSSNSRKDLEVKSFLSIYQCLTENRHERHIEHHVLKDAALFTTVTLVSLPFAGISEGMALRTALGNVAKTYLWPGNGELATASTARKVASKALKAGRAAVKAKQLSGAIAPAVVTSSQAVAAQTYAKLADSSIWAFWWKNTGQDVHKICSNLLHQLNYKVAEVKPSDPNYGCPSDPKSPEMTAKTALYDCLSYGAVEVSKRSLINHGHEGIARLAAFMKAKLKPALVAAGEGVGIEALIDGLPKGRYVSFNSHKGEPPEDGVFQRVIGDNAIVEVEHNGKKEQVTVPLSEVWPVRFTLSND